MGGVNPGAAMPKRPSKPDRCTAHTDRSGCARTGTPSIRRGQTVPDANVQVLLDGQEISEEVATALDRVSANVHVRTLAHEIASPSPSAPDASLVIASHDDGKTAARLETFFRQSAQVPRATLVLTPHQAGNLANTPHSFALPVSFASNMSVDELVGRLQTMCDLRQPLAQYNGWLASLKQRSSTLLDGFAHRDEQLRLASQVQRDLLPSSLDRYEGLHIEALYRPADCVSGDIYDVARLDETRVAISVADVTGHGLPAALLTMFVKRSFKGKEIHNGSYRVLTPHEILSRLNADLLETNLSQCQFVTALYSVYDRSTRILEYVRGGAPYPILIRPDHPPEQIQSGGRLLGAVEDHDLETVRLQLSPGDIVLMFTDGLEALLLRRKGDNPYDTISETPWFQHLGERTIRDSLRELVTMLRLADPQSWPTDDLTLLAVTVTE